MVNWPVNLQELQEYILKEKKNLVFPDFQETETICDLIIQKESRDTILRLSQSVQYIEFLIQDKKFKSVNIPNTAIFILPEYIKDPEAQKLTNSNAELTLRSMIFLPYPADTYKLLIGQF